MPNLYRVRVTLAGWNGGPGVATHYFLEDGAPTGTDVERAQSCATQVRAAWDLIKNMQPTIWTANVQTVVDVLNSDNGDLVGSHAVASGGTIFGMEGGGFGPAAAGICVNWLTANFIAGRRVRGRTFISPKNNGGDVDGTPTAAHVSVASEMFGVLTATPAGHPKFAVWHRPIAGVGGAAVIVTGTRVRDTNSMLTSRR